MSYLKKITIDTHHKQDFIMIDRYLNEALEES